MRAVFAGGGSAGHLSPSVAIAQRFLRLATEPEVLFFGARRDLDRQVLAPYPHRLLAATGLPYGCSFGTIVSLAKMARAGMQALGALRGFGPDVLVGTGGYVTAASAPAAGMLKIPCVLHVSDALPDRTNLKLAGMAQTITVAFEAAAQHFPANKVIVTGQPVREEFLVGDRQSARAELGYADDDFVFLVTGGSQGAQRLNDATLGAAPKLLAQGMKILHQTGQRDFERVQGEATSRGIIGDDGGVPAGQRRPTPRPYVCLAFHAELGRLLAAADLILMRAGASSLAEASAWGIPMILVPYPYAHGHQKHNAAELVTRGAAIMVEDSDLTADLLAETVLALRGDPARRAAMSQSAASWGTREAAERIAELVIAAGAS